MEQIFLKACAKLNLFLDITGKCENGYHLIKSVMQSVDIFDRVSVKKSGEISVKCSESALDGENNLAHKAAALFFGPLLLLGVFGIQKRRERGRLHEVG